MLADVVASQHIDHRDGPGGALIVNGFTRFVASGLSASNSAARRTVGEGGAYVNNTKIETEDWAPADADLLHGRWLVVRRGPAKSEEELSQRRCSQRLSTALCNEPCIWIQYRGSNRPINSKCTNSL